MSFGSLRRFRRVREEWNLIVIVCLVIPILALTGCGLLPFGKKDESPESALPPPALTHDSFAPANTLVLPDEFSSQPQALTPPSIIQDGSDTIPGGAEPPSDPALADYIQVPAPALTPPAEPMDPLIAAGPLQLGSDGGMGSLGLNLESYFDETEEPPERLKKLERAVSSIQRDIRTLAPPLRRLITVERDLQALITQLTQLTQGAPDARPAAPQNTGGGVIKAPVPHPTSIAAGSGAPPPPKAASPPPSGGTAMASARIRTGEHNDKTRIVFDVSGSATYRYDLDNKERLLVVELPGTPWSGSKTGSIPKSPLVSSWSASALDSGGSRVVIQLKKETSVLYETVLNGGNGKDSRIVIDLKK